MMKKFLSPLLYFLVALLLILKILIFPAMPTALFTLLFLLLSLCAAFFRFEKKELCIRRLVMLGAFVAMSVAGRLIFAPIPFFKPVSAVVILCGAFCGAGDGFLAGALAALLSNFYFGQGPWTPFQMIAWGVIGLLSGIFSTPLKRNRFLLALFAFLSGALYSFCMDFWTTVWMEGSFSPARFLFYCGASLPVTLIYALSNLLFLLPVFPMTKKIMERLDRKYSLTKNQ